mgnify:CR=1 FL=1
MAPTEPVTPVKLLIAILWSTAEPLARALQEIEQRWGEIDFQGHDIPFQLTDYYEPEMGRDLQRRLITCHASAPIGTLDYSWTGD